MCKCSYSINEDDPNRRRNRVLPPSGSSSQGTTPTNPISPSSSTSQREVSTTFISSPRSGSQSSRRSQVLEARSTALIGRDEARSGGSTPRVFLPQLKQGKLKRRVTIGSSTQSNSSGSADVDEADWPPSADEDYIVFCFEEDGAFHVVMEESPRTLSPKIQCEEHENVTCACTDENKDVNHEKSISRRDCLLPNKEVEEEEMSPQLQLDRTEDSDLLAKDKLVLRKESTESMECRNGSVESTDSSRLDWEEQLQDGIDTEVGSLPSPRNSSGEDDNNENRAALAFRRDCLLPNKLVEEEKIFLSPKSQLGMMIKIDDLLNDDNDGSSTVSSELCESNGSDTRVDDHEDQIEENEPTSDSAKSSLSNQSVNSSNSFEFPVLQWECIGSPVTWPRSGSFHFRKHKSRRPCLTYCCRF